MKEMFKKSFGIVLGVWTGLTVSNYLSDILRKVTGDEDTSKKESDFEEES